MLIAHITNLEELITLAKIQKDHTINPELYIDVLGLESINRSIPMFMKRCAFNFEELTVSLINKEGYDTLQFIFKYNPDKVNKYNELDPNDITHIICHNYVKEDTVEFYIEKQYGFTPMDVD